MVDILVNVLTVAGALAFVAKYLVRTAELNPVTYVKA